MVMIRQGGHVGFDAVTNIPPAPSTLNYIQSGMDRFKNYLTDTSRNLLEVAYDKIAMFDYGKLQQLVQATGRYVDTIWLPNEIQQLYNIGQLQHAPQVMVRWLMAEPSIRTLYHRGEAEGYGDRYNDLEPNRVGEKHRDYRIVMDGMVVQDEVGEYYSTQYHPETDFEYTPDEDQLSFIDQSNIMKSWQLMKHYVDVRKEDPSSGFNAQL